MRREQPFFPFSPFSWGKGGELELESGQPVVGGVCLSGTLRSIASCNGYSNSTTLSIMVECIMNRKEFSIS